MRGPSIAPLVPFMLVALFVPCLASNFPICMQFDGEWYFPIFHYWLSPKVFPRAVDLFWNATAVVIMAWGCSKLIHNGVGRMIVFLMLSLFTTWSSTSCPPLVLYGDSLAHLAKEQQGVLAARFQRDESYHNVLKAHTKGHNLSELPSTPYTRRVVAGDVQELQGLSARLGVVLWPLLSPYAWEEDIGGGEALNKLLPLHLKTRYNRHDLLSSLLYALRSSLFVGIISVMLSLIVAAPLGIAAGYFGGSFDLILCRFVEVWESLPQFLTLLLIIAFLETTSLLIICSLLALFGWTLLFRYFRTEAYRERKKAYIECVELYDVPTWRIFFIHLFPNCMTPVLALVPFEVMAVITRESALSFLGLGDPQNCSLGTLMDEGRLTFPQESYLLWAPAILLGGLIFAIAAVGDAVRRDYNKVIR